MKVTDRCVKGVIVRTCAICKTDKPIEQFRKNKACRLGRSHYCVPCFREYHANWYRNGGKASRVKWNESDNGRRLRKEYFADTKRKYPGRVKARAAVNNAIIAGKLPRATTCQCRCGDDAVHYHHHRGYAKRFWLDVIPLCVPCHKLEDSKNG